MHSTVLLTKENEQLRLENGRQKQKRALKRKYIAKGGFLTVEEALELANKV